MQTNEVYAQLNELRRRYERLFSGGGQWFSPDEVEIESQDDPDEVGRQRQLSLIFDKLEDAFSVVKFYERPILGQGVLHKNGNDRYELAGYEITSGFTIEILDEEDEPSRWVKTAIEHNGSDYYAVSVPGALDGKRARRRF